MTPDQEMSARLAIADWMGRPIEDIRPEMNLDDLNLDSGDPVSVVAVA